jgi:hypothetical protein
MWIFLFLIGDPIFVNMQGIHLIMYLQPILDCHISSLANKSSNWSKSSRHHVISSRYLSSSPLSPWLRARLHSHTISARNGNWWRNMRSSSSISPFKCRAPPPQNQFLHILFHYGWPSGRPPCFHHRALLPAGACELLPPVFLHMLLLTSLR